MKNNFTLIECWRYIICVIAFFCSAHLNAQNCTVNAGLDGGGCFSSYTNLDFAYDLFTLNGNSAGNLNSTPNLLWELASAPSGAVITYSNANSNTTIIRAKMKELPSGNYIFRLGINCLSGERVYDSVTYTITNICDFNLRADRSWSSMCGNSNDSIHLVGRALREGEVFRLVGRSIDLLYSNVITTLNTDLYGPTIDSLRFTIKKSNADICTQGLFSLVTFNIKNGTCAINSSMPFPPSGLMGIPKLYISKIGPRNNVDTISCINGQYFATNAYNICVKGGIGDLSGFSATFSAITLSGSGSVSPTFFGSSRISNSISNRWDTVTPNTLHVYEVTYGSNGCYPTFKDTIKIFFKSATPNSTGIMTNISSAYCFDATDFPLTNTLRFPLTIIGLIPTNCKLVSSIAGPAGANVSISNPYSLDTLNLIGTNIIPGQYYISTNVVDTISGCYGAAGYISILFSKKATLPILRDTSACLSGNYYLIIPYKAGAFANYQYGFTVLSGPPNNTLSQHFSVGDSTISILLNPYISLPGIYSIAAYPTIGSNTCNDARSDTFQLELISSGRISNAGTDQILLCNVASTNLAGSLPSAGGGQAGFWKFLPAISINAINEPIIADSASRNSLVTGFTNLSSNYFSWNVTDGNTGNYCALKPDTVLVVFSGIPPSTPQKAQTDYFGTLATNGTYTLTSNAITPTFNVQWNKISGVGGTIVNPNSQNTNVTGLSEGNYIFELVVTNTCGVFKDTVNLFFTSAGNLPVKLISFNGNRNNENTDALTWQVADELDMKNYEVQLSENGIDFKMIGEVAISNISSNNKKYGFTNNSIFYAINYYRLKMVNNDGSFAYSNILKLSSKQKNINELNVSPNPAKANLIVTIHSFETHSSVIEIVNLIGQHLFKKSIQIFKGVNTIPVDVSNLPKGVFFLKVDDMIQKLILE